MKTFSEAVLAKNSFSRYRSLTPRTYSRTRAIAAKMRGISVVHINATATGGGVAEILRSQVPLERDLGLDSRWLVISAPPRFFQITKKIHNLLQGRTGEILSDKDKKFYLETVREMREEFKEITRPKAPDLVVVHDPQPLPLVTCIPRETASILRMHIDLSTPDANTLDFLRPLVQEYRAIILTSSAYRPLWLPRSKTRVIMPAIDPFVVKNKKMPHERAKRILESFFINTDKPIVAQVSRFDPWKDPLGVIRSYYIAKNSIPDLQLVLAGSFAGDDPEGRQIFQKVKKHVRGDPDIFLWTKEDPLFVGALQAASSIIMQKSLREGFGLTMTEAMWKEKPVVAGMTEGARMQIAQGKNGILVSSPEDAAKAIVRLCKDKNLAQKIGRAARETVKKKFLFSRFLLENLQAYASVLPRRGTALKLTAFFSSPPF